MNTPVITMDREQAREQLNAYKDMPQWVVADEEHQTLMSGYKAMAAGYRLLTLESCFEYAGVDKQGRPRLAIAPANHKVCGVGVSPTELHFTSGQRLDNLNWVVPTVSVPYVAKRSNIEAYAMVPLVPVAAAGQIRAPLEDHWILWECNQWADMPARARSPVDPYLLWRLGADLWIIIAEWDLSPLEQAVVNGRAIS